MDPVQVAGSVTVLAVLFTFIAGGRTGMARRKHGIVAPATTGHPEFERAFRVHYNTIESLVTFLPVLWLGSLLYSANAAAILGGLWLIGRVIYMISYMADPKKRQAGAGLTLVSVIGLMVISALGLIR